MAGVEKEENQPLEVTLQLLTDLPFSEPGSEQVPEQYREVYTPPDYLTEEYPDGRLFPASDKPPLPAKADYHRHLGYSTPTRHPYLNYQPSHTNRVAFNKVFPPMVTTDAIVAKPLVYNGSLTTYSS